MKELNINITKAQIKSFRVELKEDEPVVSATIALITDGGKEISEYTISTHSWQVENKFDLPVELYKPIMGIMGIMYILEKAVVQHCMGSQLQLEEAKR